PIETKTIRKNTECAKSIREKKSCLATKKYHAVTSTTHRREAMMILPTSLQLEAVVTSAYNLSNAATTRNTMIQGITKPERYSESPGSVGEGSRSCILGIRSTLASRSL
ncbi:TPA: hypothetical protein DE059_01100, partial [Candidatus Peribacteria bacterium]|nr:hypothetical protein [Candidatus Peribacteria bacterium]